VKYCVVYNPAAGSSNFNELKKNLKIIFKQDTFDYISTKKKGHASKIISRLKHNQYDLLICVGGDGTISEVVNGLNLDQHLPIALIPFGTTNVLSYELDINSNLKKSLKAIKSNSFKKCFYGIVGKRRFISMLGIGFDAFVIKNINIDLKKKFGKLTYFFESIKALFKYDYPLFELSLDNKNYKAYSAIISNTKFYAGSYIISEKINIENNFLYATLFLKKGFFNTIFFSFLLLMKKIEYSKNIKIIKFSKMKMLTKNIPMHADGDLIDFQSDIKISKKQIIFKVYSKK